MKAVYEEAEAPVNDIVIFMRWSLCTEQKVNTSDFV